MEYMVGLPEKEYQRALNGADLSRLARLLLVQHATQRIGRTILGRTIRQVTGSYDEWLAARRWFEHNGCPASVDAITRVIGPGTTTGVSSGTEKS